MTLEEIAAQIESMSHKDNPWPGFVIDENGLEWRDSSDPRWIDTGTNLEWGQCHYWCALWCKDRWTGDYSCFGLSAE
jgi:hypothetical protein